MKKRIIPVLLLIALWLAYLPAKAGDWSGARITMVERDLKGRDIYDPNLLEVMRTVPRHLFIPLDVRKYAYADRPLPIGLGQTISQPYIVALMTELLQIEKGMKVLEIGSGSGYQAAVLAALGAEVYSIEIIEELAGRTRALIRQMNLPIQIMNSDGYYGWKEKAPFDRIMITAAANHVPRPLLDQLKPGGKLILPLGNTRYFQTLTMVTKQMDGKMATNYYSNVRFVPMTGKMLE